FQEVPTKWISYATNRPIRFSNELRHKVQVTNLAQKFTDLSKFSIRVDLLKIGLRQPVTISFIIFVRPVENCFPILADKFPGNDWSSLIVLSKLNTVAPRCIIEIHVGLDRDLRIAPSM